MKRARGMQAVFVILLLLLAGRLYYVQILCAEELQGAAYSQQMIPVLQDNGKGMIYDRNMTPLTGTEHAYYYLIHKDNLTAGAEQCLHRMNAEPAGQKGQDYLVYRTSTYFPRASAVLQNQYKAYGFSVDLRYGKNQIAAPLVTDLDEMYEGLLQKGEASFYFLGNAAGGLLQGTGMTEEITSKDGGAGAAALITTLDLNLQEAVENLFEEYDVTGCTVVTDTKNGQVLAMVSRHEEQIQNLAVEKAYPLGTAYTMIEMISDSWKMPPMEVAVLLGLGSPVFDTYPGEDAGNTAGKKTTLTVVQMNRLLTILANQGKIMSLKLILSTAQEESIPCMELTGVEGTKLAELQAALGRKPITGDGWAAGYGGTYAVTTYLEKGNPKEIYEAVTDCL